LDASKIKDDFIALGKTSATCSVAANWIEHCIMMGVR